MVGLRTQESKKFNRFWSLLQSSAAKEDSVFFSESGEGRDIVTDDFEGEDFSGWLIPKSEMEEFKKDWDIGNDKVMDNDRWERFFRFATWKNTGNNISIAFDKIETFD